MSDNLVEAEHGYDEILYVLIMKILLAIVFNLVFYVCFINLYILLCLCVWELKNNVYYVIIMFKQMFKYNNKISNLKIMFILI